MKEQLKRIAHALFRDYQLNRIYYLDIAAPKLLSPEELPGRAVIRVIESSQQIADSPDERIRDHAWYASEHALGYGIWEDDHLTCICWFWTPQHPGMPGRFSALGESDAVMVDLLTSPHCRGNGYAVAITRFAAMDLYRRGYSRLWTWVWHSNGPSIRVFTKTGWTYSHLLAEIQLPGMRDYFSFKLPVIRI